MERKKARTRRATQCKLREHVNDMQRRTRTNANRTKRKPCKRHTTTCKKARQKPATLQRIVQAACKTAAPCNTLESRQTGRHKARSSTQEICVKSVPRSKASQKEAAPRRLHAHARQACKNHATRCKEARERYFTLKKQQQKSPYSF